MGFCEAELFCFGGGFGASLFETGVLDDLAGGVDLEDAVVDLVGAFVCLFVVEVTLVFFGGNLGIFFFFFSSAIAQCLERGG